MRSGLNVRQMLGASLVRAGQLIAPNPIEGVQKPIISDLGFRNPFAAQVIRRGKIVAEARGLNGITIEGKNHLLDVVFGAGTPLTQVDPWYIGLIDQSPTPTLNEADTLASHAGWSEFSSYAGNRKEWDDSDSATKVKGSDTVSQFDINASGEVHGIFVCEPSTGTSGVLWATGSFDSSLTVVNGDELKITYGIRT